MRPGFLILILAALTTIVGLFMTADPQQSERLSQMYQDVALTGEIREYTLLVIAVAVGGFIAYLTFTRR